MARTPLMQFFVQMARDHAEAAQRGVPVEKVVEERVSRRTFIGMSAAVAATAALSRLPRAHAASAPRIAIIGGGISGLNAALTLQDAGIASTVYEASQRVGGRMFSNSSYWQNGQISEWCGELVDSGHKTIISLCKRFGLSLDDLKTSASGQDAYKFFGKYYPVKQAYSDWQNGVWQAIQADQHSAPFPTLYNSYTAAAQVLDNMSVYDWIETRVPGGHKSPLGALLDVAYNIEYGAETTDQSSLNIIYLLGFNKQAGGTSTAGSNGSFQMFGSSDQRYHIRGGNDQLPKAIAATLKTPVKTGYRLKSIAQQSDGTYSLVFTTGNKTTTVACDIVIMAIPFAVLATLDYSKAGFDALKNTAIQQQGRGRNGKLQLQFKARYWTGPGAWPGNNDGMTYTDVGYQNTWEVTRAQAGDTGILVDYTGGNVTGAMTTTAPFATVTDSGVSKDANKFLSLLEQVLPGGTSNWNGRATSSLPHLDPNFGTSYSYWRKGQYTQFAGYEKVRQANVFFAGEHCSIDWQGYMEGGAEEGERAASEVLAQLSGQAANKPKKKHERVPASVKPGKKTS